MFPAVESGRIGVLTEWAEALTVGSRSSGVLPMANTPPVPVPEESRLRASENDDAVRLSWKMVSMTGEYATWVALGESLLEMNSLVKAGNASPRIPEKLPFSGQMVQDW